MRNDQCRIPKDRGWAWVILFANIFMNLIIGGVLKSFGIFFSDLQTRFQTTSTNIASLPSIMLSTMFMTGLFATRLADRYTSRVVVSIGGMLIATGYLLSTLAPNVPTLFITYGGIMGVGLGFVYAPSVVVLNHYFSDRRALANGLSGAGSGIGSMSYPPVVRILLSYYSLVGTFVILASWTLNLVLCASLMRPTKFYEMKVYAKEKQLSENSDKKTTAKAQFDWLIVKDPVLWIYSICAALSFGFYLNMYVMIVPFLEQSGHSKDQASFVVSMIGACDIISRVIFGYVADFNLVPKRIMYQGTVGLSALLIFVVPLVVRHVGTQWSDTFLIAGVSAAATSSVGLTMALNPTIYSEAFGPQRLSNTFGVMTFAFGFALLFISAGMGLVRDLTGSWVSSFHASAVFMALVFLLLCLVPRAMKSRGHRALNVHGDDQHDQQRGVVMTLKVKLGDEA